MVEMNATATRRQRHIQRPCRPPRNCVFELATSSDHRIDAANCVLRHVKIVGLQSVNPARVLGLNRQQFGDAIDEPYSYDPAGLDRARKLYEGASVYSNHAKYTYDGNGARRVIEEDRSNKELVGWLENVVVESDGLYGDLHYLETCSFVPTLLELADRRPDKLALSHEAVFENPRLSHGRVVLGGIKHVDCVALVSSKPGTTAGLFESAAHLSGRYRMTTIGQVFESCDGKKKAPWLGKAIEADASLGEVPVDVPDDMPPDDQMGMASKEAVMSLLDTATPDQLQQIMDILQSGAGLDGMGGDSATEPAPPAGPPAGDMLECVSLFNSHKVPVTPNVLEAALAVPKDKRAGYVEELAGLHTPTVIESRSAAPKPPAPKNGAPPTADLFDGTKFLSRLESYR